MAWRKIMMFVGAAIGVVALGGCSGADTGAPAKVAVSFLHAASSANGSGACALLSDTVAQALSQNSEEPCNVPAVGNRVFALDADEQA